VSILLHINEHKSLTTEVNDQITSQKVELPSHFYMFEDYQDAVIEELTLFFHRNRIDQVNEDDGTVNVDPESISLFTKNRMLRQQNKHDQQKALSNDTTSQHSLDEINTPPDESAC